MYPEEYRYTKEHEWVSVKGDVATIGITDHAQKELGDIVYVELPEAGSRFSKGDGMVVVESVKAASDVYAPVSGEVTAVNDALEGDPALINNAAQGEGWLIRLKLDDESQLDGLLDDSAYKAMIA